MLIASSTTPSPRWRAPWRSSSSCSDFYRAFDASLDTGGRMKRSIASLLRAIGARSEQLPHRLLAEAIRAGDEEQARVIARAMVVGAPAD